eukprot:8828152-Lingulodinium_polyedra.AAC.1
MFEVGRAPEDIAGCKDRLQAPFRPPPRCLGDGVDESRRGRIACAADARLCQWQGPQHGVARGLEALYT